MKIHFKRKGKILEVLNPEILSQAPFKIVEVLTLNFFSHADKNSRAVSIPSVCGCARIIPLALGKNSGLDPINILKEIESRQVAENNAVIRMDCLF